MSGSLQGTLRIRDAMGRLDRFEQRVAARRAAESAEPIVARLFDQGLEPSQIVVLLKADESLGGPVLHAALNLVLRRSGENRDRPPVRPSAG